MTQRVSSPIFVGRAAELARLRVALTEAASGRPATVVVAGEAGVGKSRLISELAAQGPEFGAITLTGGCLDVEDGLLAYAPIVEALRSLIPVLEPAELDRVLRDARPELSRLVPELGSGEPAVDPVVPARFFAVLNGVLRRLAEQNPVLLLVEDLHWADRSTRDLLAFLVRNLRGGVAMVLTYRTDELHRRHPLRPFLAELGRNGRVERIELAAFNRREMADLLGGILGRAAEPTLVTAIQNRSAGNPFFAEELLAAGRVGTAVPPGLRDVVLTRVEALSEPTQRVLRLAAVAGQRVDHQLLRAVSRLPHDELVDCLREAVAQYVLLVDGNGEYVFRHALVQEAVYDELLPAERPALHAAYAAALANVIQDRTDVPTVVELGQLAYHWYAAHDLESALIASVEAGRAAEAAYALAEAQRHYERALALWDTAPIAAARSPLDKRALLQRAAEAASLTGDSARAIALVELAMAGMDATAEPAQTGALFERLGRYHWFNNDRPKAMQAIERAVAIIPADPLSRERAHAVARHGAFLMLLGREVEAWARCEEALALCRRLSPSPTAEEAAALNTLAVAQGVLGHLDVSTAHFQEAQRIADQVGFAEGSCRVRLDRGGTLMSAGDWLKASESSLECYRLAGKFGLLATYGAAAGAEAARSLVFLGRWDEAAQLLDEVFELGTPSMLIIQAFIVRAVLRLHRGDLVGARADLDAVLEGRTVPPEPQYSTPLYTQLTEVNIWDGRFDDARDAAAEALVLLGDTEDPDLVATVCLAGVAAEAAIAVRARTRRREDELERTEATATALRERARAAANAEYVVQTPLVQATLKTIEAECTRVTGTSSPESWDEAAAAWHDLNCPYPTAYATWRQSEALLGGGSSHGTVAPVLLRAWTTANGLGAQLLTDEIVALARRSRIELPNSAASAPATRVPDTADDFGLTGREREVLALLGDGRTNRQIGEALFISNKTVSVHVSNILAKLNAANRGEAAALGRRLGLT